METSAIVPAAIGAINWGLVGLAGFDPGLFGNLPGMALRVTC